MKRAVQFAFPIIAVAAVVALSVIANGQADDEYYWFALDAELTGESAASVEIAPKFNAVGDDAFPYEIHYNVSRTSSTRDQNGVFTGSTTSENWVASSTVIARENPLEGNKNLQLAFQFDQLRFVVDNGKGKWSGVVNDAKAEFTEVMPDGAPNPATAVPGWAGVSASDIQRAMRSQSGNVASAWATIDDQGKLTDATYFADLGSAKQASYPARLLDPVDLMRGMFPQWNADLKMNLKDAVKVRRSFPVSGIAGGTIEYDFTYTLNKLHGTTEEGNTEATAAAFSFTAEPVQKQHTQTVLGLDVKFTPPSIKAGYLLFDLVKGVPAIVSWKYSMTGNTADSANGLGSEFEVNVDFSASLQAKPDDNDAG
ncbi:hypothetical protein OAU50_04210 [Planctomycetota bacterium]|nr:hypothetical protein [Planctomycetota bacterium]